MCILIMFHSPNLYDKQSVRIPHPQQPTLSHSYVINVPKTVTFNYRISPCRKSVENSSRVTSNIQSDKMSIKKESQRKIVILHRNKKREQKNTMYQSRKGKMNVLSSRISHNSTQSPLKHQESCFSTKSGLFPQVKPNHISVSDSFACDIFQCNGEDGVDQWERKPFSSHQSKLEDITNSRQIASFRRKGQPSFDDSREKSSSFNESFGNFSKRKNIFDTSTLNNTTIDAFSYERSERSRSKNRIFGTRETRQAKSMPLDHFLLIENEKIESPYQERSPNFGVQRQEQFLEISDIPKYILDSWEQFTESSAPSYDSRRLEVVNEANLEESEVR